MSWQECCLKKKYGGLGLVDPEEAKTSLLGKWIVRAMEPGESSLQLMLRYRLARFNPQRGKSWGVDLEWFTCKKHQGFSGSKVWGHINKAWKNLAKSIYQLPPRTRMELLHSNIWWSDGMELLKEGFSYSRGLELYRKGIRRIDDVWNSNRKDFLTWEVAQHKFNLTPVKVKNGRISRKSFRRSGEENLKRTRTPHIPECGSDCMWKENKTPHLWLDAIRNFHPLLSSILPH